MESDEYGIYVNTELRLGECECHNYKLFFDLPFFAYIILYGWTQIATH